MNKLLFCFIVGVACAFAAPNFNEVNDFLSSPPENGKIWALLVAGSNTFMNYRHQADICHSYQILHSHGIPDEQIVVMMYDDIAYNEQNTRPGIIINHINGSDVYHGVPKDYTGEDVTPENFLSVLQGKQPKNAGSGKVIDSGPNDNVFVYFADHGAPGLIAFPSTYLYSSDLNKALTNLHTNKRYSNMVIYIEACESGTMFDGLLPTNTKIFATTAANTEESSYACYLDDDLNTYLGDCYSVNWMEDSDREVLTKESLQKQFQIVKEETTESHVMEYGDLSLKNLPLSDFQGGQDAKPINYPKVEKNALPSREVPLFVKINKLSKTKDENDRQQIRSEIAKLERNRKYLHMKMKKIHYSLTRFNNETSNLLDVKLRLKNRECYEDVTKHFNDNCFNISKNPYTAEYLYILVNLCEKNYSPEMIKRTMTKVCTHPTIVGII